MNKVLKIVPAGPEHALSLASLHNHAFARAWDVCSFESYLSDQYVSALLALDGPSPQPVGFMVARMTGAEAEILTIAVEPARRREGIGRALCEKLVALLRARGVTRMVLEVGVQNKGARRLYDGLGFSTVGKRPAYYGKAGTKHREDALIMALQLAEGGPP